ncbi:DUF4129 domain-containing protein [Paenibacillus marchantiophytorum]|nr:DUF4129 domain-containing protein [Paenibacillus marchantiophytorum]
MSNSSLAASLQEDKEQLKQILEQKEYTAYEIKEHASFWSWLKPLFRKLRSLLPDFKVSDSVTNGLTIAVMIVLLGIAAFAIYWFLKQLIWQKRVKSVTYLPEGEISRSYSYYWKQAEELRGSGHWREGVRSVFLTLLFFMETEHMIRVEKWKTNWEYAEELKASQSLLIPLFEDSSLLFDRIWYGQEAVTEEQFNGIYEQVARAIGRKEGLLHERAE